MATTTSRLESGRPIQYTSHYRTNDGRAQTRDGNEASGRQATMDQIRIRGGRPLQGSIEIGGAKNAALPLMTTCLLTDGTLTLSRVPDLADINTLAQLLEHHGVEFKMSEDRPGEGHYGRIAAMTAKTIKDTTAPYELVRRMRASILVLGPIVPVADAGGAADAHVGLFHQCLYAAIGMLIHGGFFSASFVFEN